MSIVKISEELHALARVRAKALNRSINMQAEHWMRIGKMVEENPDLTYRDVWKKLIAEAEAELASESVSESKSIPVSELSHAN